MPFASLTRPADRPELRYFFDPLCGWCYGFSPVLLRLYEELKDELDFVAHPGGMIVGDRVGPLGPMADYIGKTIPRLAEMTGVTFGPGYHRMLAEDSRVHDSVPPSRALTVLARLDGTPARTVPFAHELLLANFRDGLDVADPAVLVEIAARFDLSERAFLTSFTDPDTAAYTQAGFTAASQIGITGFPTLVLRRGNQGVAIARGWAPYEQVRAAVDQVLATPVA